MFKYRVVLKGRTNNVPIEQSTILSAMSIDDAIERSKRLCVWELMDEVISFTAERV